MTGRRLLPRARAAGAIEVEYPLMETSAEVPAKNAADRQADLRHGVYIRYPAFRSALILSARYTLISDW